MQTKTCPDCQSEQPLDAKFCGECGRQFPRADGDVDLGDQPDHWDSTDTLEQPPPLPDKLPDVSRPEPPRIKTPPDAIKEVVVKLVLELDTRAISGSWGGSSLVCSNDRAVFFKLNREWGHKAVPALLTVLCADTASLERYGAALLVGFYLRESSAKGMTEQMLEALAYALSVENHSLVQSRLVQIVREAPTPRSPRFQRLYSVFRHANVSGNAGIIRALGELASPGQREGLAAEMTELLNTTNDSSAAAQAAEVISQFGYRQAWPHLINAAQSAPSGTAYIIARLLRDLTPPDAKKRAQVGAVMSKLLCETSDRSLAFEASKTIVEFGYQEACAPLRKALKYAPISIAALMARTLVAFQDKHAAPALRARLSADRAMSSSDVVEIARALHGLEGDSATKLLFECFRDAQSHVQRAWITFFKEKNIHGAREVVREVRDTTANDGVRQAADDYLKAVPGGG